MDVSWWTGGFLVVFWGFLNGLVGGLSVMGLFVNGLNLVDRLIGLLVGSEISDGCGVRWWTCDLEG